MSQGAGVQTRPLYHYEVGLRLPSVIAVGAILLVALLFLVRGDPEEPTNHSNPSAPLGSIENPYSPALNTRIAIYVDAFATIYVRMPSGRRYYCSSANLFLDGPVYGTDMSKFVNRYEAGDSYVEFRSLDAGRCTSIDEDSTIERAPLPDTVKPL